MGLNSKGDIWHIFVRSKELGPTTSRAWCRTCDVEEGKCHEEICDWSRLEPWFTSMLEHSLKDTVGTPYFMAPEASRSCFHLFIYFQLRCWLLLAAGTLHDTWAHMHDICSQLVFGQQALIMYISFNIDRLWKTKLWLSVGHMVLGLLSDLALAHFKHYNDLSHPMSYLHITIHHWDLSSPHRASALLWRARTSSCQDDCRGLCGEDGFLSQMGSYRTVCRIYKKICGLDCKKYISTCWHLFEVERWSNYVESRS